MLILVVNAGSSSLKFQLLNPVDEHLYAKGFCDRIGIGGQLNYKNCLNGESLSVRQEMPDHKIAINSVIRTLTSEKYGVIDSMDEIEAVGHRVVHGGEKIKHAVKVTPAVKQKIKDTIPLAPLHNKAALVGIEACEEVMPGTPMVAVFDTSFHSTMPDYAYIYALPYVYYQKYHVRKYGFHGTSHDYVSKTAAEFLGKPRKDLKIISCHLGNGSSLAAIKEDKVLDTAMGMTPVAGVTMGTRTGDMDPAVIKYLLDNNRFLNLSILDETFNKYSGVLGISGISSDFRDLYEKMDEGDYRATLAVKVFSYQVKKYIGSLMAAMGGVDLIIFTAGLGENSSRMREDILSGLEGFGIAVDHQKNQAVEIGEIGIVSAEESKVKVMVVPTNEELEIAKETYDLVNSDEWKNE